MLCIEDIWHKLDCIKDDCEVLLHEERQRSWNACLRQIIAILEVHLKYLSSVNSSYTTDRPVEGLLESIIKNIKSLEKGHNF